MSNGLHTLIFTGLSGAGKTTALRAVEDLGFYCVDNLPLPLLDHFVQVMDAEPTIDRAALVVDARVRNYIEEYGKAVGTLQASGRALEVIFLDAKDAVLVRRFSQTRRRHPLGGEDLIAGLETERELLAPLQALSNVCIDTSDLTPHQLKQVIQDRFRGSAARLVVSVLSFGFRYGIPSHVDLVFDVRFLPNPYFDDDLRHLTGMDPRVAGFVLSSEDTHKFMEKLEQMLRFLLPRFEQEGKVYLTVAIGCTGGRHRSVALAEELSRRLEGDRPVNVRHRDIEK